MWLYGLFCGWLRLLVVIWLGAHPHSHLLCFHALAHLFQSTADFPLHIRFLRTTTYGWEFDIKDTRIHSKWLLKTRQVHCGDQLRGNRNSDGIIVIRVSFSHCDILRVVTWHFSNVYYRADQQFRSYFGFFTSLQSLLPKGYLKGNDVFISEALRRIKSSKHSPCAELCYYCCGR